MSVNDQFELSDDVTADASSDITITWTADEPTAGTSQTIADGDGPDQTSDDITITWTANEPTAATTQTIADGDVPTVAELGQYVANINAQLAAVNVDKTALKAACGELFQFAQNMNTEFAKLKTTVDALVTQVNA